MLEFPYDQIITSLSMNETEFSLELEQNSVLESNCLQYFCCYSYFEDTEYCVKMQICIIK